jgi:hypothetical protein
MNTLNYDRPPTQPRPKGISRLLWIGLAVLIFGSGPLFAMIIAASLGLTRDPNPNPIGPGILAFFTFWPGVALTIVGAITTWNRRPQS